MSEISEEEDALLAELLLNTDLVSEENVEMVRELKSSFREQGVRVSIVDLLVQSGFLSRSDLNSLRSMADEKVDGEESIMPPRFEHPFLTQQDLAERAKEEGVISEETYRKVDQIRTFFDENGVNKTGGEILVEQGFVEPHELQFDEESSEGEGMFDISSDQQETVSDSSDSETQKNNIHRASVISELDRYVFEELIERGRMQRAQIPSIVEKARKKSQESSGTSPVQEVLREQGILHPSTESEVVSAAMDRRDEAERWRNRFSNVGPMAVTIVLIICVVGIFFLLYGSGEEQVANEADTSVKSESEAKIKTETDRQKDQVEPSAAQSSDQKETKKKKPSPLLTFRTRVGAAFSRHDCDCELLFDGQAVTTLSEKVQKNGQFELKVFPGSGQGLYAPGGYILKCTILDTPGTDFPPFPSQFRNALEENGPANNALFEKYLNEELWNFATAAGLSSSNLDVSRKSYALELRNNLESIINQWEEVKSYLTEEDPESRQLLSEYSKLNRACGQMVERLDQKRKHRTFYYPSVRRAVRKHLRELPMVTARIMIEQRRQQNVDVPDQLRKLAGSGSGGSMQSIQSIIDSLQDQIEQLPGEDEQVNPLFSFEPVVTGELRKLAEVVRVLSLLRNDDEVRRQAIEQNQEMLKYALIAFFKYSYYQIRLRSILLDRTSQFRIFEEETAGQIEGLSDQVQNYLQLVVVDLADAYNIDLPERITEVDGSVESVRADLAERFSRVDIDIMNEGTEE